MSDALIYLIAAGFIALGLLLWHQNYRFNQLKARLDPSPAQAARAYVAPEPAPASPAPATTANKGLRIALLVSAALGVLLLAGPALIKYTEALQLPLAGTFDIGVLEVPVLGAFQFFAAVSIAFVAYYVLFHKLYAYVRDCMEEKLFSALTQVLVDQLPSAELATAENIAHATEARHIAQFQFRIRCVRFLLSLLPFFFLLVGSLFVVNNTLAVVPH